MLQKINCIVSLAFVTERAGCALKGKSSRAVAVARNHLLVFRARVAVWEVEDTCDPIRTHTDGGGAAMQVVDLPTVTCGQEEPGIKLPD